MTEEFLHYLWKLQNFSHKNLYTQEGHPIHIIKPGLHNYDSGPDFSDARIRIGDNLWAGNVEIHISSSDWMKHGHQNDQAYGNVILHVVYEHDREISDQNGQNIPVLELKGRFDEYQYWRYEQLVQNKGEIPCYEQFSDVDYLIRDGMLERVLVERIEDKTQQIKEIWEQNQRDWNETFYQWMARGFGLKVNSTPMLVLARSITYSILARHKDNLFQLEALLFGVAGMLDENSDEYALQLQKEFGFLREKYELSSLEPSIWKYSRLRPPSFPDLRIAQFASLLNRSYNLFSEILSTGSYEVLDRLLAQGPSTYWHEHYRFGLTGSAKTGGTGKVFRNTLVINVIVPFLFLYGKIKNEPFYTQRALDILEQIEPENNRVTRVYSKLNLTIESAFYSQAVIQLYNGYCGPKKCLNCGIGIHILKH